MSAYLGPDPLPATISREHVAEHRSLFCSSYDACLDRAAHENWASFTCARCERFHAAGRAPRPAPSERGERPVERRGDGAVPAAPAAARRRPPPAASPRDAHAACGGARPVPRDRVAARATPGERPDCARPRAAPARAHDACPDRAAAVHSVERGNGSVHLHLEAPCMTALFVEAARAVAEIVDGLPLEPAAEWVEDVSVAAPDREHLLDAWIADLVVRSERARVRFTEIEIVHLSERRIVASIRGARLAHVRAPVRPATYHDPCLVERREHVTATPVLGG